MDEEIFEVEAPLDDAINAFMNALPDDQDDLSEDDNEATEADEAEDEDVDTDDEADGEADPEDEPEDDDDEAETGDEEDDDEDEPSAIASDDAEVAVTVDGKEHRVSVKDLKRLYGQEAALTQRSQALSEQRRALDAQGHYVASLLQRRYETAVGEAAKYKDVDLFRASRELEPEEFDALRQAKQNADSELAALEREGQEFLQRSMETRQTVLKEQAKESIKEIVKAIPEWNDEVYSDVRRYAITQGMDPTFVNEIVDPAAMVMMYQALQYSKLQQAKTTVQKKVVKAPKKVAKKAEAVADTNSSKLKAKRREVALDGGSVDDVTELFLMSLKDA